MSLAAGTRSGRYRRLYSESGGVVVRLVAIVRWADMYCEIAPGLTTTRVQPVTDTVLMSHTECDNVRVRWCVESAAVSSVRGRNVWTSLCELSIDKYDA